jgi:NAD+ synthase
VNAAAAVRYAGVSFAHAKEDDMERLTSHLVEWLETQVSASGGGGTVLGLSGGIDSAVVAALCVRAFAGHTLGVIMPCESDPADAADARLVAERFALRSCTVDLTATLHTFSAGLAASCDQAPGDDRAALANIKARLRMTTLYAFANHLGYRVIGTGNASELAIGYFTKYGDGGVDLLPLGNLTKTTVRELARHLGVPQPVIDKPPSAGLWSGQTDEGEMGFSYEELDAYLGGARGPHAADIARLVSGSAHKRATAALAPAFPAEPSSPAASPAPSSSAPPRAR